MALCVTLCLLIKLEGRGDEEMDLKLTVYVWQRL
jgi:hypothetical protein